MSKQQKRIHILLGVLLIICVMFSIIYIGEEKHHDCSGQGCPICLQIHAARDLLNSIKGAVIIFFLIKPVCIVMTYMKLFLNKRLRQHSLVTLKVELLN